MPSIRTTGASAATTVSTVPATAQSIQPTSDVIALTIKQKAAGTAVPLRIQDSGATYYLDFDVSNHAMFAVGGGFEFRGDDNLYLSTSNINKAVIVRNTASGAGWTFDNYGLTPPDGGSIISAVGTGIKIATAITQKLGFYNATPVAQRAGAAQVAVATTAATNTTPYGFTTAAQADAIVALVNELRAWAVAQGFIKGAA